MVNICTLLKTVLSEFKALNLFKIDFNIIAMYSDKVNYWKFRLRLDFYNNKLSLVLLSLFTS